MTIMIKGGGGPDPKILKTGFRDSGGPKSPPSALYGWILRPQILWCQCGIKITISHPHSIDNSLLSYQKNVWPKNVYPNMESLKF